MADIEQNSEFLFYSSNDGTVKVTVVMGDETVWTTQKSMGDLFGVESNTITYHLKEIYKSGELEENATTRKIRVVRKEGKRQVKRLIDFYNLDAIISVGYRVNSYQATQFRKWATKTLKEYLIKGFVLDDERLKQGNNLFGKDYFEELLERIREIRASERRFYQKITDIYAQCSIDYDKNSPISQKFYATVQNKLHYAITRKTAAEIVRSRANAENPHMGLTSWKNAPVGKVQKSDISTAKNYLNKDEIKGLNRLVNMYLDYAENQASRQIAMKMEGWATKLDAFLEFNEYDILKDAGNVSAKIAKSIAEKEYNKFRVIQDREFKSDFDRIVEDIKTKGKLPEKPASPPLSDFNKSLNYNPKEEDRE